MEDVQPRQDVFDGTSCPPSDDCISAEDCSNHGECENGVCVCGPDYTGSKCEHSILENPVYFPMTDPAVALGRCWKAVMWEAQSRQLQSMLYELHHPERCDATTVMLMKSPGHGLGGNMHFTFVAATRAFESWRAVVFVGPFKYASHDGCNAATMSCYFLPHTNCTEDDVDSQVLMEGKPSFFYRMHAPKKGPSYVPSEFPNYGIFFVFLVVVY